MVSLKVLNQLRSNSIPFVSAKWFTPTTGRTVSLIVLHSMEAPEKPSTAEGVAEYFRTLDRKASAHYCVDNDSIVQCVQTKDVAYGAPGANHNGVHVEMAGYAAQTAGEWNDPYSLAVIENAAYLTGLVLLKKFPGIPLEFVDAAGLKTKKPGITTHAEVTKAFHLGTHTDPGTGFPMAEFLRFAKEAR